MLHNHRFKICFRLISMPIIFCVLSGISQAYTYDIKYLVEPSENGCSAGIINEIGYATGSYPNVENQTTVHFISDGNQMDIIGVSDVDSGYNIYSINDKNQVVGLRSTYDAIQDKWLYNSYIYKGPGEGIIYLTDDSYALGINNKGQVIVNVGKDGYSGSLIYGSHVFTYDIESETMHDIGSIGILSDKYSQAWGINNKGQIVGYYYDPNNSSAGTRIFLYSNDAITDICQRSAAFMLDINNKGQITSTYQADPEHFHSFIYSNGTLIDLNDKLNNLLGDTVDTSFSKSINDNGQVVGTYEDIYGQYHGFIYNSKIDDFVILDNLYPCWINNRGQILDVYNTGVNYIYSGGSKKALIELIDPSLELDRVETYGLAYIEGVCPQSYFLNDAGQLIVRSTKEIEYPQYVYSIFIMKPFTWQSAYGGSWGGANWAVSELPGVVGDTATFGELYDGEGNIISNASPIVTLDGNRTVSALAFNNSHGGSYTISPGITIPSSKLIMDNTDGSAAMFIVQAGSHTIVAPVELKTDLMIKTILEDRRLTISGEISESTGPKELIKTGEGMAILSASNSYTGKTSVDEGILELASTGQICPDSLIYTETDATFRVNGGTHVVGMIEGTGATELLENSQLTVIHIYQDHVSIAYGAKLIIAPTGLGSNFTPVPEPSTILLLAIGMACLLTHTWVVRTKF